MLIRVVVAGVALAFAAPHNASAQPVPYRDSIFLFGGVFTTGVMGTSLIPGVPGYESNYILGGAYQRQFYELGFGFLLGGELGVAGRFGDRTSGEIWGGISIRTAPIPIGNVGFLTPGIVIGLSAVTSTIGEERIREITTGGNASLLGYLGPELAFTFRDMPNLAIVYRLHHRSGLFGAFGAMREGHNAQVLGLRWQW
jgi:hypothetical protein